MCHQGPTGPIRMPGLGTHWVPPDHPGFLKWVIDAMEALDQIVRKVVEIRKKDGVQSSAGRTREDPRSHPC